MSKNYTVLLDKLWAPKIDLNYSFLKNLTRKDFAPLRSLNSPNAHVKLGHRTQKEDLEKTPPGQPDKKIFDSNRAVTMTSSSERRKLAKKEPRRRDSEALYRPQAVVFQLASFFFASMNTRSQRRERRRSFHTYANSQLLYIYTFFLLCSLDRTHNTLTHTAGPQPNRHTVCIERARR